MAHTFTPLGSKDLLSLASLAPREVAGLFETAAATKRCPAEHRRGLSGRSVIMLFEKPSLRTRVTFEVGPARMGGHAIHYDHSKERIGERESVRDYAKNLERWVDCVVARVFSHAVLEELARETRVPVVNALSDLHHPCQGLADYFTLAERVGGVGGLRGFKLAYVGDGNNVCHSLMQGAALTGAELTVITPAGYEPSGAVLAECVELSRHHSTGGSVRVTTDTAEVRACRAVYTDTWVSMGQEGGAGRTRAFEPYRVDEGLMAAAAPGAWFMHCLPAHRGEEVADAVIDSAASVVYDQAENRMHVQNALLLHLLGGR